MPGELSGKAAIVGIGATDFSKDSGRSELRLAVCGLLQESVGSRNRLRCASSLQHSKPRHC